MFEYAFLNSAFLLDQVTHLSVGDQFERSDAAVELGVLVSRLLQDDVGQLLVLDLSVFLDFLVDEFKVDNAILDAVLEKNFFLLWIGRQLT